jgi:hypothetical protein
MIAFAFDSIAGGDFTDSDAVADRRCGIAVSSR